MKQLIAVDFESLISNEKFFNEDGDFFEFRRLVKRYHSIAIDDNKCLSDLKEINKFLIDTHNSSKTFFNDWFIRSFGSSNFYKFISITENSDKNIYVELAKNTPDKILVSARKTLKNPEIKFYDFHSFTSSETKPNCVLYRVDKTHHYPPNYYFTDFNFLRPFIFNSETIELADNYLFKNESLDGFQFIIEVLKLTEKVKKIIFHIEEPLMLSVSQTKAKTKIKNLFPKVKIEFKRYLKEKYHDRYIITDLKEFSITFTHSFNNIKYINSKFNSKDAFEINISKGRKYDIDNITYSKNN